MRCSICDRELPATRNPALPAGICADCARAVAAGDDDLPVAQVVAGPPVVRQYSPFASAAPSVRTMEEGASSERPQAKIAPALFVAALTLLGIMAALVVVGYAIVSGLKRAAKQRVEVVPTMRMEAHHETPRGS